MRIHEQPMMCRLCGYRCILDECELDCGEDGTEFGCPTPDCGGIMKQVQHGK